MNPGDKALERIIAEITAALAMTGDPRLALLQRSAIAMRLAAQVAHMERRQGLRPYHVGRFARQLGSTDLKAKR